MRRFSRGIQLSLAITVAVLGLGGFASPAAATASGTYNYTVPTVVPGTSIQNGTAVVTEVFAGSALLAKGDCYNFKMCFWTSANYTGTRREYLAAGSTYCVNISAPYDNNASSAFVPAGQPFTLWESYNGTGDHALTLLVGDARPNFNMAPYWYDNIASSVCNIDA